MRTLCVSTWTLGTLVLGACFTDPGASDVSSTSMATHMGSTSDTSPTSSLTMMETESSSSTSDTASTTSETAASSSTNDTRSTTSETSSSTDDASSTSTMGSDDSSGSTGRDTSDEGSSSSVGMASSGEGTTGGPPEIPPLWYGPVALLPSIDAACPQQYPDEVARVYEDLAPGEYTCECACTVREACDLYSTAVGRTFDVHGTCSAPPAEDDCIIPLADSQCSAVLQDQPGTPAWGASYTICGGIDPTAEVATEGPTCIHRAGDHSCPAAFPQRTLAYRGFDDTRSCSGCDCDELSDGECSMVVEICSVGIEERTLSSEDGDCHQLNSSDGDGVGLLDWWTDTPGACAPTSASGQVLGDLTAADPETICCD